MAQRPIHSMNVKKNNRKKLMKYQQQQPHSTKEYAKT